MNCKNCGNKYNNDYKYCPYCSQNADDKLTLGTLFSNTINNYFSVDSRIFRSIVPLLFKPGFLPKKYVEGKKLYFMHPAQLYLFISVIFFFIFSFSISDYQKESDVLLSNLFKKLDSGNFKRVNASGEVLYRFDKKKLDSLIIVNASKEQLLGQLGMNEETNWFDKLVYNQLLKFYLNQGAGILKVFYSTISIALFVLIPLFTLLLKLLFSKSGRFSHQLVFSFYFFSFLFTILSCILLISYIVNIPNWIYVLVAILITVYLIIGINRFFNKSITLSIFKTLILLLLYCTIVLPMSILLLGFISLLLF